MNIKHYEIFVWILFVFQRLYVCVLVCMHVGNTLVRYMHVSVGQLLAVWK